MGFNEIKNFLIEQKDELLSQMRSDESFDFTIDMLTKASKLNFSSKPNNLRNLATLNDKDSNKNALVPVRKLSKKAGRRLAKDEDKEDCEDQIEYRIKAIKMM